MISLEAITAKLRAIGGDHGTSVDGPRAAVAALLRDTGRAGPELFFILRAEHPDDPWSGHVAFPGGRRDPEDVSLLMTAIRETREEVGIDLSIDRFLARLPDVPAFTKSRKGNLVVTPFVFEVDADVVPTPNEEVAKTLWVPLETLGGLLGKTTFHFEYDGKSYELPCLHLEPGKHRLWGLTYRMLETLLDAVR